MVPATWKGAIPMACGCSGGTAATKKFVVTKGDGTTVTVATRHEAIALARDSGGKWETLAV